MKRRYDSIIFDMDGVLVSNETYRLAIQKTVSDVLWATKSIERIVPLSYIETIKAITGFNNDWDTSYALIQLLGSDVPVKKFKKQVSRITPEARESPSYRFMKRIFQQYYVGNNFDGLITQETLLLSMDILAKLKDTYQLGIATSRPSAEARYAAKNLMLSPDFIPDNYIVAKEDAPKEKPYPDPLIEARNRMNVKNPIYIGDTINDVIAAAATGMPCIYVGTQNIGDIRIQTPNQIMEVLL